MLRTKSTQMRIRLAAVSALESVTLRAFEAFARAQRAMYLGGDPRAVGEWLTPDVIWHVPGQNAIARDYHGRDAVLEYFVRRRAITGGTMAIIRGERPVSGDVVI